MKNSRKKYLVLVPAVLAAFTCFTACRPKEDNTDNGHTHTFNTAEWKYDGQSHWHEATCEHTDEQGDKAAHKYTETVKSEATCTAGATVLYECACGYSYEDTTQPLGHDLQPVEAKAPTCEQDGYGAYQKCSRCDYTEGYKVFLKTGKHIYSTTTWEHDAISHWRPAICGCDRKSGEQTHSFDENNKCVCGYEIANNDSEIEKTYVLEAVNEGKEYKITGLTDAGKAQTSLEIPTYYKGKPVTSIAARAFEDNQAVTSVKLAETITVIGREAFNNCAKLETVTFADRLVKIEESAFGGCEALLKAELPESVTDVGAYAFEGCTALKTVNLPKGLKSLGDQAFAECAALEKIDVPASIKKINDNMFLGCTALNEVVLHEGTTSIGVQAFARCAALESIALPRGLTFVGQSAFRGSGLKEVEVPETVTAVGSYAFAECAALAKASLPATLTFSFGGWFEGCKSLAELTVPFVGSQSDPDEAVSTAFGYIFGNREPKADKDAYVAAEEDGVTYYIPVALKKVTVLKGTVCEGAFDGCSQLEEIAVKGSVVMEAVKFDKCTAKITWIGGEPTPELSDVTLDPAEAETSAEVTLTYHASAASVVTVSVKKGEEDAAETDYTYTAESKTLVFHTAGTYTVTVTAKIGENEVSKSATVTVTPAKPELSDVTVAEKGNINTEIELSFTSDEESTIVVTAKKGEADATAEDFTYNAENKTITFKKPGNYTVTVTATRNGMDASKSASIRILDPDAPKPEVTLTAGESSVTEGAAVSLTASVTYAAGTEKEEESFKVTVKKDGEYVAADAELYELTETGDRKFTPKVAGEYKVTLYASNTQGGLGEAAVEIVAEIAEITLAWNHGLTATNGYLRMATGSTATDLAYAVTGYTGGYNVAVAKDVADAEGTLAAGKLSVSSAEAETVTYKIVYAHKTDSAVKQEISVKVGFVTDLANAPVLAEDPFGGTYGTIIPSTGLMLYFDAVDKNGTALTYADISYEIVSHNVTISDKSSDDAKKDFKIVVGNLYNSENYPYILVENFENNTATGTVTVKLTATKDGATAAAIKVFEVKPLAKDGLKEDGTHKKNCEGLNDYVDAVAPGKRGDANYDKIVSFDNRQNSVVSKEGLIISRGWAAGNVLAVEPNGADNFQIDFAYTPLMRRGDNTKVSFAINYRTGSWNGYQSSQTAFYSENAEDADIIAGYWGDKKSQNNYSDGEKPKGVLGTAVNIRIIHTVADKVVTYKYLWSHDGQTYHDWLEYTVDVSEKEGNLGAPVYALQFNHEEGGYLINNVKLVTAPELEVELADTATVEEAIDLTYTASEDATVTVAVMKGDAAATAEDYTYNKETGKIHFLKEGTYKVTVTANNGLSATVEKTVTVTAPAPTLTDVTLAETAETDAALTLAYTTDADGKTQITVTVKKGDAAATADDYTYTEATKTLVFKEVGSYTVTVTATRNGKTASETRNVAVSKAGVTNPVITLTIETSEEGVTEGDSLALTKSVDYADGTKKTETLTVEKKNAEGAFVAATENTDYTVTDTTFKPLVAGEYKVTLSATTEEGGVASKSVSIIAKISEVKLAFDPALTLDNGYLRVVTGETGTELAVKVEGYAANYTVAVLKNGEAVENLLANGKLTVQNDEADTAEYKIVYTHNADDTLIKELAVKVSFVTDLEKAPVLGADPFDGTYGKLIPGVGLVLYSSVEGEGVTIGYTSTNATIVTADNVGTYVRVANADNAKVTVKLTATKDSATAATTKTFDVVNMTLNDYIDGAEGYDRGDANYNAAQGALTNKQKGICVVAKDGLIAGITTYDGEEEGDDLFVVETKNKNNFYVDLELTPYVRRQHGNDADKYSFTINYRQESINGWIGSQVSFWSVGNGNPMSSGYWGDEIKDSQKSGTNPDVALGETVKIRIIHTVVGNEITFRYEWSKDGNTYTMWREFKAPIDKNIGKPIYAIQFNHECGCFKIGNVEIKEGPDTPSITLNGATDVETPGTFDYTATEDAETTVSFKKGDAEAVLGTDYTYDAETKEIHFLTGGTYTVTVTSTLNGVTVSTAKTVTVTVPEPELSDVELKNSEDKVPEDYIIETEYTVNYTLDSVSEFKVTVKKGEVEAEEGTDYTLTDNKITFKTEGTYRITVTATRNEIDKAKSVTVEVKDPNKVPDITFTVGEDNATSGTVEEGTAIAFEVNVTYKSAATKGTESFKVAVEKSGKYEDADAALYELDETEKTFKPLLAGNYRITFTAVTQEGVSRSASVDVIATVANLSFAITEDGLTLQNGSVLVQSVASDSETPASVTIPYTLTGYTGGYELAIAKYSDITWEEGENQLTASYKGDNAGGYVFTYKHKSDLADKALWKVFTVKVGFVADTANALTFGADPFGGTHGRLIPSTGLVLYHDAVDKNGNALTYADISYEIIDRSVNIDGSTKLEDGKIYITTKYEHNDVTLSNYPYIMIENFENNTATGTITVKLTATKDGASAAAIKVFEVKPLEGEKNNASGAGLSDYIAAVAGDAGDMANYDAGMSFGNRQNCVICKDGVIFDRAWASGNVTRVDVNGSNNFQVDFVFTALTRNERISFAWKFITGSATDNGETGHSAMYFDPKDGVNDVLFDAGYWSGNTGKDNAEPGIEFTLEKKVYVRITHTVKDGVVTIKYEGSLDGTAYCKFCQFTANVATAKGDIGSPVYGINFFRENELGQLTVGNFKLTYLD